ncbi:unnamed protein product, partial [Porites evermanni]
RVKTYLRSTIRAERSSGLALLHAFFTTSKTPVMYRCKLTSVYQQHSGCRLKAGKCLGTP